MSSQIVDVPVETPVHPTVEPAPARVLVLLWEEEERSIVVQRTPAPAAVKATPVTAPVGRVRYSYD